MMKKSLLVLLPAAALALLVWNLYSSRLPDSWTDQQLASIQSLSLYNLPPLAPDPSNAVADDETAAEFGQLLYFDTRLSSNNTVVSSS